MVVARETKTNQVWPKISQKTSQKIKTNVCIWPKKLCVTCSPAVSKECVLPIPWRLAALWSIYSCIETILAFEVLHLWFAVPEAPPSSGCVWLFKICNCTFFSPLTFLNWSSLVLTLSDPLSPAYGIVTHSCSIVSLSITILFHEEYKFCEYRDSELIVSHIVTEQRYMFYVPCPWVPSAEIRILWHRRDDLISKKGRVG